MTAPNVYRIDINTHERLCFKLVIYKDHTRMHGQQNIKNGNMNTLKHVFKGQAVSHITHFSKKKFFKLRIVKKFYLATGTYVLLSCYRN